MQIADALRGREIRNDSNFDEKIEYIREGTSLRDVGAERHHDILNWVCR